MTPLRPELVHRSGAVSLSLPVLALAIALDCASNPKPSTDSTVIVYGTIRDRDGHGVEGVDVALDSLHKSVGLGVTTHDDGRYGMRVKPGTYVVSLTAADAGVPDAPLDTVSFTRSRNRFDYRYQGGVRVLGRVTGPHGVSVSSGTVTAESRDSVVHAYLTSRIKEGRYRLFLPAAVYHFGVNPSKPGIPNIRGMPARISRDTTIDFELSGDPVRGRVTLGSSLPLAGTRVSARAMVVSPDTFFMDASDTSQADGTFSLYLPAGKYFFWVQPNWWIGFIAPQTFDDPPATAGVVTLDMSGTEWAGTVRDSSTGTPAESVSVWARDTIGGIAARCTTGRDGHFRLVLATGWKYSLQVIHGRTASRVASARAERDSTFDLFVDLGR
jgi:hypothetical protein